MHLEFVQDTFVHTFSYILSRNFQPLSLSVYYIYDDDARVSSTIYAYHVYISGGRITDYDKEVIQLTHENWICVHFSFISSYSFLL